MTAYRLVLALGLLCLAPLAPAAEIHWSSCPEERPATSAAALDCGVLATEDKLAGEPVRLGLARLRYRPDRVSAAPVVFVPGGPAQPAGLGPAQISAWQRFQQQAGWPRDIVLFDPRATGDSRPEVACAADEGAKACGQRIGRSTLAGLSMSAAVDDLHALIAALDQGPVVLWAHSFGVFVARALAARYPDDMAGVVLEAPAADQQRGSDFADGAATRALERIARSCGAQACVIGVPSTRALLKAWRVALARRPVRWATARVPYPSTREQIDDDTLVAGILFSQYRPDTQSDVAARLRRALRNVQALVPIAVPVWHMGRVQTASSPAYWAMRCSIAPGVASPSTHGLSECRPWAADYEPMPLRSVTALHGLLVYAMGDVVTPAGHGRAVLAQSPGLAGIGVKAGGHQPLRDSACAQRRVSAWLASGQRASVAGLCGG